MSARLRDEGSMDFAWSDEQKKLLDSTERFAREYLQQDVVALDREGSFNRHGWDKCGEFGVQGLAVPKEYGGLGLDAITTAGVLERFGYACRDNGLIFAINAHLWTVCMPLVGFGTEEQKRTYLPKLCNGQWIGCNAITEPEAGCDAYSMKTTAERRGDTYVLNGRKTLITNGQTADVIVALANVDPSKGAAGISAFIVHKDNPGFKIVRELHPMGMRTSPLAELAFENCVVPVGDRVGKEGVGTNMFQLALTWERGCILASAVGSMQWLLEKSIKYARTRKQFGQPIGRFQLVGTKIVDMKLRLESARYMLYHAGWLRTQGKSATMESSMAKLHISDCWVKCCEDAMQVHGGLGYLAETELERTMRDAMGSRFYSGANEVQRQLIAQMLI
jgi:alkylation response protein AidB-like acyl-CoA dehydrogenase